MLALTKHRKKLVADRGPFAVVAKFCRMGSLIGVDMLRRGRDCAHGQDAGVSAAEFRKLSRLDPESADLLLRRMEALDLDPKEVGGTERRTFQDLQRVCAMRESHRRCTRDLAHDAENPVWEDYCPNADTLKALSKMPWISRREW